MPDKITIDLIQEIHDKLKQPEPRGFVMLPSVKGFDLYEFDAEKLKTIIKITSLYEETNIPSEAVRQPSKKEDNA